MAFEGLPVTTTPALTTPATPATQGGTITPLVDADAAKAEFLALLGPMVDKQLTLPGEVPEEAPLTTLPGVPGHRVAAFAGSPLDAASPEGTNDDATDDATSEELLDLEEFIAGLCPVTVKLPPETPGADPKASGNAIAGVTTSLADSTSRATQNAAAAVLASLTADAAATTLTADAATPPPDNVVTQTNGAHVQLLAPHHQLTTHQGIVLHHELRAPVGSQAWTDQLGDHLTWMAQNNRDVASLRLSPEHLGPVEVRLCVREGEASVWFGATHADTRSALEQSLPKLREMFASQGLVLADAGVFRDAPRHQPTLPNSVARDGTPLAEEPASVKSVALKHPGLIDTYV